MLDILALLQVSAAFIGIGPFVFHWIRMKKYSNQSMKIPPEPSSWPSLTIVLPVWNEEMVIQKKLEDLVKQDYPKDKMEILLIDSNSSDSTMDIFHKWNSEHSHDVKVKSIQMPSRLGKSAAINRILLEPLDTDAIVITDADALLADGALRRIGRWLSDPNIGAVCGSQQILGNSESNHIIDEKTYRSFYHDLRIGESTVFSSPIFEGSLAAYRNSLVLGHQIDATYNADDSQLAVLINRSGSRSIMDSELCFFEYLPSSKEAASIRRLRRASGLVHLFSRNKPASFSSINRNFSRIMRIESWIHLIMPLLVLISLISMFFHIFISAFSVVTDVPLQVNHTGLLIIDSMFLAFLLFGNKLRISLILRSFFVSQWTLIVANFGMYRGVDYRYWEQDIESRKSLIEK